MTKSQMSEIRNFVATMFLDGGTAHEPMCWKEAEECINEWKAEGVDLPAKLTPYYLATVWDEMIKGE